MPIYEYQCDSCGNRFEKIERFSDAPLTVHEECGGHVERLISSPAFHFKGTGWYVTDYAKKNGKTPAAESKDDKSGEKAEKKDAADRKSKSEGGSDTKVESKSETKSESTKSESSTAAAVPAPTTAPSTTPNNSGKS